MRRYFLAALCVLAIPGPATAGDDHVSLGVHRGNLSVVVNATRSNRIVATVRDARGTGHGWTLSVQGSATVASIAVRCASGSTCTLPTSRIGLPVRTKRRTPVLEAIANTGMGAFSVEITTTRTRNAALRLAVSG
jgi:hypothetical protein